MLDIHLSEEVPYPTKKLVSVLKDAIRKESFDPFEGELRSTEKQIKGPFSARLTYEQIITMHWLNSNIIGIIPEYGQLSDKGKEVYELTGTGS